MDDAEFPVGQPFDPVVRGTYFCTGHLLLYGAPTSTSTAHWDSSTTTAARPRSTTRTLR